MIPPAAEAPTEVLLVEAPCPIGCGGPDRHVLTGWDRLNGLPGRFTVVQCEACGLMRTNPRPSLASMQLYYPPSYGPFEGTRVPPAGAPSVGAGWRRFVRDRIDLGAWRIPALPPGRLLEIGCASGRFLHEMQGRGWAVSGIEASPVAGAAARAEGFDVHIGPLEEAPDPPGPVDLVVGWMVLEHLHDPLEALRRLAAWTRPGGWMALSVPNTTALALRLFGDRWHGLQLPTHLYHFTPPTAARLLRAGGWDPINVFHQRLLSDHLASLGYGLQERAGTKRLGRWLEGYPVGPARRHYLAFPLAWLLAAAGQSGRMTIWARRR